MKCFGLLFYVFISVIPSYAQEISEEVKIGKQTWMTKNLNVSTFRNGDTIPQITDEAAWVAASESGQPAWCYYDNDPENEETYGKLYNWYAVNDPRGLAPEGWHVPSDEEWDKLTSFLFVRKGDNINDKLKSCSGWMKNMNGSNTSGFNALPGGCRKMCGSFDNEGEYAKWWTSSTSFNDTAVGKGTGEKRDKFTFNYYSLKHEGLSVRCVKD